MAQCWYLHGVRKWKIWGAVLLIPGGDAAIWLGTAASSQGRKTREI